LVLAANTAFNGFPVLASILARDRYLPRQLHNRGDRLVYSNGVLLLAGFAIALIVGFDANIDKLIQLYIVGVGGAYLAMIAMLVLFLIMKGINAHYRRVSVELTAAEGVSVLQPSNNHAIVLVSGVHLPTLRALGYAKATRPHRLTALSVDIDAEDTRALQAEWERRGFDVPLTVLESPYREITRPILDYVQRIRRQSPRDVVTVFIPEYVVGHWWEQLLRAQEPAGHLHATGDGPGRGHPGHRPDAGRARRWTPRGGAQGGP